MDDASPNAMESPLAEPASFQSRLSGTLRNLTTYDGWVGDYDYKSLCMPRIPFFHSTRKSRSVYFGIKEHLPVLVAALMGFQHALAMVGGVIAVPRILSGGGNSNLQLDSVDAAYLISTALVVSGLASWIQIVRIKLVKGYWIGTGLISMSGVSFTFLPIAQTMFSSLRADGTCPESGPCRDAYGMWLGTIMVGALLEIGLSFIPLTLLRKAFPPLVTGVTVFLIGASLIPVGLRQWAGGTGPCFTVQQIQDLGGEVPQLLLDTFNDCPNNFGPGDRHYPWGSAEWIGLGFFVFTIIIVLEIFGSPFMRNSQVMIGLIAGIILAASLGYMNKDIIDAAPNLTFPLVRRFRLGFYGPAIIPVLLGYLVSTVETLGDIAASSEASRVATQGPEFESRIQGGLLADGLNSLLAGLLTSSPTTTFSQNNGVIVMTRTANTTAGLWAAGWLILAGIIGKVGGVFVALPDAALGGMTTFLFANVAVSGVRILSQLQWDRRERFILAISLSLGLGVVVVPGAFIHFIPDTENSFANALREGVLIILTTGYSIAALLAMLLNFIIPKEDEAVSASEYSNAAKVKDLSLEEVIADPTEARKST